MNAVRVGVVGRIIHAIYEGTMTLDLVKEGEQKIEALIPTVSSPAVLYDTLAMKPPSVTLAMEMKSFDSRIASRVTRCATVVADPTTAFCAKVAFVFTREHRVFYNDRDAAIAWLNAGNPAAASR